MLKGVCGVDNYTAWTNERQDGGVKLDLGDESVMHDVFDRHLRKRAEIGLRRAMERR